MAKRKGLKEILLTQEGITEETVSKVFQTQREKGLPLYKALQSVDAFSEEAIASVMCEITGFPYIDLRRYHIPEDMLITVPAGMAKSLLIAPLSLTHGMVTIASADPLNVQVQDRVKEIANSGSISIMVGTAGNIKDSIDKASNQVVEEVEEKKQEEEGEEKETLEEMMQKLDKASSGETKSYTQTKAIGEEEIIRLVDTMLHTGIKEGSSDIHLEPYENVFRLRYRLDGQLKVISSPPIAMYSAICSRIKIMSDLNIAEHRIPQDGRMKINVDGREIDFRISILPIHHGEKVVMRILDKEGLELDFTALGFDEKQKKTFIEAIEEPNGIILVTGPTGSGKTTTLYSALSLLNKENVNLITLEDPVEYDLYAINQVQANAKIGLTFASGLRSILRQDPDIIMVGEIRDGETADIAIKAALTGHLVLSTLHTNDAVGAIFRMLDMGAQPFMLSASLNLCQAQRLVRKLCPQCKRPVELPEKLHKNIEHFIPEDHEGPLAYGPQGCTRCAGTGYKGRSSIIELLPITPEIKELIAASAPAGKVYEVAKEQKMQTLYEAGIKAVLSGKTSLEEIMRVTVA